MVESIMSDEYPMTWAVNQIRRLKRPCAGNHQRMRILTVNPGSSSVRMSLVTDGNESAQLHTEHPVDDAETWRKIGEFIDSVDEPDVIAHRLVHGGDAVRRPTVLDDAVRADVERIVSLAPLHIPATLRLVDGLRTALPGVVQVLCPDTAFHDRLSAAASTYAIPSDWRRRFGLRRYGFHGLSYAWALSRAATMLGRPADDIQLVAAHLGGGASVCAIRDGHSVDTSMGFTPLDGIPMSRRSGAVDPGMLLWLLDGRIDREAMDEGLNHASGLYGLSDERSDDTRVLVRAAAAGEAPAQLALDVYAHRVRREFAAAATSLERIDALVFTGEIGWDQPEVRTSITDGLGQLGVRGPLDDRNGTTDRDVAPEGSTPVLVIEARENLQLALDAAGVLADRRPDATGC
jgi:acetate kinase